MSFCPKCKIEYKSDVSVCPDCGVPLVESLPPEETRDRDDNSDSVLLLKTDNYMQAQLLAGALEEADIPYWAKRLGMGRLGGSITGAITHVIPDLPKPAEIYVNPSDLTAARKILSDLEESVDEGDDE